MLPHFKQFPLQIKCISSNRHLWKWIVINLAGWVFGCAVFMFGWFLLFGFVLFFS